MVRIVNDGKRKLNLRFGVKLIPGENEIDADAWEKCRADTITRHFLESRILRVVSGSGSKTAVVRPDQKTEVDSEPDTAPTPTVEVDEDDKDTDDDITPPYPMTTPDEVGKMKAKDLIGLVQGVPERATLKALLMTEKRPTVRAAIEQRLADLRGQS